MKKNLPVTFMYFDYDFAKDFYYAVEVIHKKVDSVVKALTALEGEYSKEL